MKKRFFKEAKSCLCNVDYTGASSAQIGAVAVYHGMVIARGWNQNKTHTLQQRYNIYRFNMTGPHYCPSKIHAEMDIISKIRHLDIDFRKVHIYVYRETKNGDRAMSRPCESCCRALRDLGVRKVFYTTDKGYCEERYD